MATRRSPETAECPYCDVPAPALFGAPHLFHCEDCDHVFDSDEDYRPLWEPARRTRMRDRDDE